MIDDTKMDENGNSHVNPQYSIRVNKEFFKYIMGNHFFYVDISHNILINLAIWNYLI